MFIKLWLHAYSYTFKDIAVVTEVPEWAHEKAEEESESLVSRLRAAKFVQEDILVNGS